MKLLFKHFGFSAVITVAAVIGALLHAGFAAMVVIIVLILIEVAFSFDNAIVNAKILGRLSKFWQQIFLTVGIVIAIFGMRLIFPVLIVALSADLPWGKVIDLALHHPHEYSQYLEHAKPVISAFGGAFLLMLSLQFFVDERRSVRWFDRIERKLQRLNRHWSPIVLTVVSLGIVALLPANSHVDVTLRAGVAGLLVFVALQGIVSVFDRLKPSDASVQKKSGKGLMGWAAFATFMYLEILDASFSFDGVIGAFAVTSSVILIALGLGVGAVWVRSLTVYMVRRGTLDTYRYLEHGAHYTIAILAITLLLGVFMEVPEWVVGLAGVAFIGGSYWDSHRANRRER